MIVFTTMTDILESLIEENQLNDFIEFIECCKNGVPLYNKLLIIHNDSNIENIKEEMLINEIIKMVNDSHVIESNKFTVYNKNFFGECGPLPRKGKCLLENLVIVDTKDNKNHAIKSGSLIKEIVTREKFIFIKNKISKDYERVSAKCNIIIMTKTLDIFDSGLIRRAKIIKLSNNIAIK